MSMTPEEVRLAGLVIARETRRRGLLGLTLLPIGLAMVAAVLLVGSREDWWVVLVVGGLGLLLLVLPFHSLHRARVIRREMEVWDPVRFDVDALPAEVRSTGAQRYWFVAEHPGAFDAVRRGWIKPWHLAVGWLTLAVIVSWAALRTALALMAGAGGNWAGAGISLVGAAVWWGVAVLLLRTLLSTHAELRQHRRRTEAGGPVDEVRRGDGPWLGGPQP